MNSILVLLFACCIATVLIVVFYYYMNFVRQKFIDFDTGKIKELPWYTTPRWVRDAWDPTWAKIQRTLINIQVSI